MSGVEQLGCPCPLLFSESGDCPVDISLLNISGRQREMGGGREKRDFGFSELALYIFLLPNRCMESWGSDYC